MPRYLNMHMEGIEYTQISCPHCSTRFQIGGNIIRIAGVIGRGYEDDPSVGVICPKCGKVSHYQNRKDI